MHCFFQCIYIVIFEFKYVKIHWQLHHNCIFVLLQVVTVNCNEILHHHKIGKDYPMQEKFIYYIAHLPIMSFAGTYLRILISVKDTWFLETRTDVPMFSRSITCSATVPAFHFKEPCHTIKPMSETWTYTTMTTIFPLVSESMLQLWIFLISI